MKKKKATREDIKEIVRILKKHEAKPDKDGFITIPMKNVKDFKPSELYSGSIGGKCEGIVIRSPLYRDSVGTEELKGE